MKSIILRLAVPSAGAVLMLVGALLLIFRPGMPDSGTAFGWTAYAPLSGATFPPANTAYLPIAIALVMIGFCAIAVWIGFELGRGSRERAQHPLPPAP